VETAIKEKTTSVKYFNMEEANITGFYTFCKNNIPLVFTVSLVLFFTFGIKLFWNSIGIDTELFIANQMGTLNWALRTGRFGFSLLSWLLHTKEFNPFFAFFTGLCLIWLFSISWCYIISIFSQNTGRNNKLIPFALIFMTMPVWAEQFYFLSQIVETTLMLGLCPYIIYLLYKGILDNEKGKIIISFLLLVFMISVYQVMIPIFCCGVFACFVLLQEHSDYKPQIYRNLCLKLLIILIGALVFYSIIDNLIIPFIFNIEKADYLDNMNYWGKRSLKSVIFHTFLFCYNITIGHIPLVHTFFSKIISHFAGEVNMWAFYSIPSYSRHWGNVLLLPAVVFFLIGIFFTMRKTLPPGRRLLYFLAGIGIPLSIMLLTILGGGSTPPLRSLFALPLAFSFMLFHIIKTLRVKSTVFIVCVIALFCVVHQAKTTSQLFYSDQMRYNDDVRLAYKLEELIKLVHGKETLPVVFIGKYQTASRIQTNFLQGEVIGHSFFEWGGDSSEVTYRSISFMKNLGININGPDRNQLDKASKEAIFMPSYPAPGCVVKMDDFIIVKLSEERYPYRRYSNHNTIAELPLPKDIDTLKLTSYDMLSIDVIDDNIVLYCGNIDPQLNISLQSVQNKPSGEPFIEITYTNSEAGYLMVHFDYGDGLAGQSNNTGFHHIEANLEETTIILPIVGWQEGRQLFAIRIDPPDNTVFMIKKVKFLSAE
jgi:hypothetical protein